MINSNDNYTKNSIEYLKNLEVVNQRSLQNFFLIYTFFFYLRYVKSDILEFNLDLPTIKEHGMKKINKNLFNKLNIEDDFSMNYISWFIKNPPFYSESDVLGTIYLETLEISKRKKLGEHYTRNDLVKLIIDDVLPKDFYEKRIVDPACGSGNFIIAILRKYFGTTNRKTLEKTIDNIYNSKFIIGIDIQEIPCLITKLRIIMELIYHTKYINPDKDLPIYQLDSLTSEAEILTDSSYDYVLTNPPYLRYQLIDLEKRKEYKKLFSSSFGRFDLYTLFIEKGIKLIKKSGKLIVLSSDKFMTSEYGKGIRNYIKDNGKLIKVIDLSAIYPFSAAVLSAIYYFEKSDSDISTYPKWLKVNKEETKIRTSELGFVEIIDKWRYVEISNEDVIYKIKTSATCFLEEIVDGITIGLQTTADKVFCKPMTKSFIDENKLEKELFFPLLRGRNLKKWSNNWNSDTNPKDTYVLYPYIYKNKETVPIELSSFPNTSNYLNNCKYELENRTYFKLTKKKWFEHWTPHNFDFFKKIKILTPDLASDCSFSLDLDGSFYNGTAYSICLKDNFSLDDYKYLLGILNSKLINYYHKRISSTHLHSKRYRFQSPILKKLPIVLLDKDDPRYKSIVKMVESLLINNQNFILEERIDNIVYNLYQLSKDDIDIIEASIN
jgi:adenine-specific DNA-methyltransferase